eukprot:5429247-Pyramimonas_sp.AAC.1
MEVAEDRAAERLIRRAPFAPHRSVGESSVGGTSGRMLLAPSASSHARRRTFPSYLLPFPSS